MTHARVRFRELKVEKKACSGRPNTRMESESSDYVLVNDQKQQLYQRYWAHHLWVYRQVLVWTTRVLTLQDRNILYLLAVYSAANAVVMLLMSIGQSPLFMLGLFFLMLAATHIFSILSNNNNRFRLLSQWNDKEEELFKKICYRVAQGHVGILRMAHTLMQYRSNDPKKFYGIGILSAVILSNIGYLISDFLLLHALVNFVLLVPLILHYRLHLHLANQNWIEIRRITNQVLNTLTADLKRMLQSKADTSAHHQPQTMGDSRPSGGASPNSSSGHVTTSDDAFRARKT